MVPSHRYATVYHCTHPLDYCVQVGKKGAAVVLLLLLGLTAYLFSIIVINNYSL